MNFIELEEIAKSHLCTLQLSPRAKAGWVACALETKDGNVYTGINVDLTCGVGTCAEQSAITEMVKNKENIISKLVTVRFDGDIRPPCGKCREVLSLLAIENCDTLIQVEKNKIVPLKELLPYDWKNY